MFEDRVDAGNQLCPKLKIYSKRIDFIVVGLMRGGLITAKTISDSLHLKLFPLYVKKLSTLANSELAIGALVSNKDIYLNKNIMDNLKISEQDLKNIIANKNKELERLMKKYKITNKIPPGENVLLVDDGVATGATVLASAKNLKKQGAKSVILVTPVIAEDTFDIVKKHFDDIIYLIKENNFFAVGQFYRNFSQVEDWEIESILKI